MKPTVILPYTSERTTAQDLNFISRGLHRRNPEVQFIPFNSETTPVVLAEPFSPRTLTVTLNNNQPSSVFDYIPGPKFFAPKKSKRLLAEELAKSPIPMPYTETFNPELILNEQLFGPYIAIKTTAPGTARARGIHVCRTDQFCKLREKITLLYADDIAAGHNPLVQQYVMTGPKPTNTRVSTFLGAPIVCFQTRAPEEFFPDRIDGLAAGEATSNYRSDRTRVLSDDPEMVALARRICRVYPTASVLSIDMVRCTETQKVYCLEVNLGNLCVLSAPICNQLLHELGVEGVHKQFGAYDVIAQRIIETLAEI